MEFVQVDEEGIPQFSYDYLLSLTEAQRDEILGSIPFVDKPITFSLVLGDDEGIWSIGDVINYSKCYEAFSPGAKEIALSPNVLRTGDIVRNGTGYRGIGTYYCVWLHRDLLVAPHVIQMNQDAYFVVPNLVRLRRDNDEINLDHYQLSIPQWQTIAEILSDEMWYKNTGGLEIYDQLWTDLNDGDLSEVLRHHILSTYRPALADRRIAVPELVPREADGPHNDGDYELYLFKHPGEYDYLSSAAVSNAPNNYFVEIRGFNSAFVDPLLTHTRAYYYGLIRESKDSDRWRDDPSFPNAFVGECDRLQDHGDYRVEDTQWYNVEEMVEHESTHALLRHVFSEHCRAYHSRSTYVLK